MYIQGPCQHSVVSLFSGAMLGLVYNLVLCGTVAALLPRSLPAQDSMPMSAGGLWPPVLSTRYAPSGLCQHLAGEAVGVAPGWLAQVNGDLRNGGRVHRRSEVRASRPRVYNASLPVSGTSNALALIQSLNAL